ncbi:MAG: hypothetical protein U1F50_06460 [Rubrivivax sp.]
MDALSQAMRGALSGAAAPLRLERALVVGGGGTLGSALLGEALVAGRFQQVAAVVAAPLASAVRGFVPVERAALGSAAAADVAFVVFERERHSNGRDDAFWQPPPDELVAIARTLRGAGVRRLLVVVPHAPALLPHSLKHGFASRAEGEVAALGFEHLVLLRAAQAAGSSAAGSRVERFVAWWLSQLRWMVPQAEQPVRAVTLAALAVQLARLLPAAAPGTRVLPPELLQQAAQGDAAAVLGAWLGRP